MAHTQLGTSNRCIFLQVGTEAHPETDCSIWDADLTRDSGVYGDDDDAATLYWVEFDAMWSWVEAGACTVDPTQLPNW